MKLIGASGCFTNFLLYPAPFLPSTLRPGECYQIGVGAIDASEGDYNLSINCTIADTTVVPIACGSNVTGSTVGLPGLKAHIFCSNETGRVEASTCGSNFDTEIWVNSSVLDTRCGDCPSDTNARCIGFNVRCDGEKGKC